MPSRENGTMSFRSFPIDPITMLMPRNPSISVSVVQIISRSTDFEALTSWKGRSGSLRRVKGSENRNKNLELVARTALALAENYLCQRHNYQPRKTRLPPPDLDLFSVLGKWKVFHASFQILWPLKKDKDDLPVTHKQGIPHPKKL